MFDRLMGTMPTAVPPCVPPSLPSSIQACFLPARGVPIVYYHHFVTKQPKRDAAAWTGKPHLCNGGTACAVNKALAMVSLIVCHTLDRYADTASAYIRLARAAGCDGGCGTVVSDHGQADRRAKRSPRSRALVPVRSPGARLRSTGQWVERGRVVFLKMDRPLFREAGAVAAYCLVTRTIAVVGVR